MSLRAKFRSFLKTDGFCALVLCLLAPLPYLPAALFHLSLNPINYGSGLVITMHRGVTLGGPWLDPNTSFTIQALGGLSAHDWLHGVVPWWNPYTGVGIPLAAEMQTISFFLPFVLLLHFANGVIFIKICLQIIAGLATYALLRQLGLGRFAAFAGAVLYEFNGPFAWFAHGPIMPIAFLPLLLLGLERAFVCAENGHRGGWFVLGVALAYSIYAGFPETAFLDGLLALVWAVYRLVVARPGARLRFAIKVAIGGVGGLMLAAPIIVPFLEYQGLSGIGHTTIINDGYPQIGLVTLLFPYIFGPIAAFGDSDPSNLLRNFWGGNGGYLGFMALFLAILALFSGKRARGLRIVLAIWVIVFVGRVLNVFHLGYLVGLIPGMNFVAVVRYCVPSFAMASTALAAFALDDWRRGYLNRKHAVVVGYSAALILMSLALWMGRDVVRNLLHNLHGKHYPLWLWGSLGWALATTAVIAVLCSRGPSKRSIRALGAMLIIDSLGLFAIPPLSGLRYTKVDSALISFLQRNLGLHRFYTLGPFNPNYSGYFGIASINHNAIPIPAKWIQYITTTLDPTAVAGNPSLFVGFFPGPMSDRESAVRTHMAGFEDTAVKYILSQPGVNSFEGLAASETPKLVYRGQVADVFELPNIVNYFEAQGGPCEVSASSRWFVHALCEAPATLIRRELFYPGWRAFVNGRQSEVTRSASIFQTISLPAGESNISFSYRPRHIGLAYVAAITGLILVLKGSRIISAQFLRPPSHAVFGKDESFSTA